MKPITFVQRSECGARERSTCRSAAWRKAQFKVISLSSAPSVRASFVIAA